MFGIVAYMIVGIILGIVVGLIPGIHPNTVALFIAGYGLSTGLPIYNLVVLIVSCSVVNTFVNYIPSIFLGAPEDDSALSVLPGHKMLLNGLGYQAVKLTVIGGLGSLLFCFFFLPFIILVVPLLYNLIRPFTHIVLLAVVAYMIYKSNKRFLSLSVFFMSGFLGVMALSRYDAMFPLLTGLFGLSLLFTSVRTRVILPPQNNEELSIDNNRIRRSCIIGSLAGLIAGLLPGIGSAQATVLAQEAGNVRGVEDFLISIGGVNTADIVFSFTALFLIGNPRSGAAVVVGRMIEMGSTELLMILSVALFSASIGALATIWLSRFAIKYITKINYQHVCLGIFILLLVMVFILNGFIGMFVAIVAFSIGVFTISVGVRKSFMMGVLILPTVLYFAFV